MFLYPRIQHNTVTVILPDGFPPDVLFVPMAAVVRYHYFIDTLSPFLRGIFQRLSVDIIKQGPDLYIYKYKYPRKVHNTLEQIKI